MGVYRVVLVFHAPKEGRKTTPGEFTPYLGDKSRCTTETSDIRTLGNTAVIERLVPRAGASACARLARKYLNATRTGCREAGGKLETVAPEI